MNALFTAAMTLREVEPGVFEGELNKHWTIGPKVHGGAMLALCANAARKACGGGQSDGLQPVLQPVSVSASFLWAPDPGPMRLATLIRKRGRRISVVDVELTQGDRTAVHAVVNLGEPEHYLPGDLGAPLLSANPVVDLMPPEPPGDIAPIGPGPPGGGFSTGGCWWPRRGGVGAGAPAHGRPPAGDPDVGASARRRSRPAVCADVRGFVGAGDLRGGSHRLGAHHSADHLPSGRAGRRLAAGDLHLHGDRAGLVR
jgi:acyl-coenzyme A thioesterase PaaI-like protein